MKKSGPLRVLFATPECAPWAKTGGLGEVSAGLPAALAGLGVDVRVLMPAYRSVLEQAGGLRRIAALPAGSGLPPATLLGGRLPSGVRAMLIDSADLYARAGGPYQDDRGVDYDDNALRFGLLSRVAALLSSAASPLKWRADVLHCNDWPTGLAPAYLKAGLPEPAPSVVTIHNLAFQGIFPLETGTALGLPAHCLTMDGAEYWGRLSFLKAGLFYADRIVTVSPTYAQEILDEHLGCGMQGLLRARRETLSGILNGIDTETWDPRSDPYLPTPYGVDTLDDKRANKRALQAELRLAEDDDALLLGMVTRLTDQKGVDLVLEALPQLFERPLQLALLGNGDPALEAALREAEGRWPQRMAAVIGFDEGLAHRIEAGADAFLMPSLFEPCGLNQMYSQRYGTPPIVRATGGLADSVDDYDAAAEHATGFAFVEPTAAALVATVERALAVWQDRPAWQRLCRSAMGRDFSWTASAHRYRYLYDLMTGRSSPRPGRAAKAGSQPAAPVPGHGADSATLREHVLQAGRSVDAPPLAERRRGRREQPGGAGGDDSAAHVATRAK
ncbi:glycogen synthase GlgA [Azoarcus olearius]|uniref:Glycogen synthase n=1 Tax=Azoarcus sp. (strain BH72) TaxID=418699 RepID=A1K6G3_AZOSB|nr:glycogen synthase GlgA [Azoarcus olearius]ANQ84988.1 putative glycogen synthase [Azoarcus olearius]CAL94418.1 putative glycogen synthase [Azoarcus olearius]